MCVVVCAFVVCVVLCCVFVCGLFEYVVCVVYVNVWCVCVCVV